MLSVNRRRQALSFCFDSVVIVVLSAHTLADSFLFEHLAIILVLILPSLIGMENQTSSIWYGFKGLI